ncbi:MAG: hypothetical protein RL473_1659, partial [Actinomycetota bacterium]
MVDLHARSRTLRQADLAILEADGFGHDVFLPEAFRRRNITCNGEIGESG